MAITTHVHYRGLSAVPGVDAYVQRCVARLERSFDRIHGCAVTIELPHRHQQHGRRFHATIVIEVPGRTLTVSHDPGVDGAHADVHVALRDAFRAARRQLDAYASAVRVENRREAQRAHLTT
jgi:ribosome-associated translation inhibitor RaiA